LRVNVDQQGLRPSGFITSSKQKKEVPGEEGGNGAPDLSFCVRTSEKREKIKRGEIHSQRTGKRRD